MDTSDKSYVHDVAVSWVENVTNDGVTACVMAAGYKEKKSYSDVTVDWMAYRGWWRGHVTVVDWYDLCDCHVSYNELLLLVFSCPLHSIQDQNFAAAVVGEA